MKLPPGYGYPSRDEWKTGDDISIFDRAVILTFQIIVCCTVPYSAGVIVWGFVMGIINSIYPNPS